MKIAVAMSGGVDSSSAAALLKEQGHELVGFTMQLWNQRRLPELAVEGATGRCCSLDDVYDARAVANILGIPYYVLNFEEQFEQQVVHGGVTLDGCNAMPASIRLCQGAAPPGQG